MLTSFVDHEIFRLKDELESNEGPGVTFYGTWTILLLLRMLGKKPTRI